MSTLRVNNVAPTAGGTSTALLPGLFKALAKVSYASAGAVPGNEYSTNVSSLEDAATGAVGLNFTNPMSTINYIHGGLADYTWSSVNASILTRSTGFVDTASKAYFVSGFTSTTGGALTLFDYNKECLIGGDLA